MGGKGGVGRERKDVAHYQLQLLNPPLMVIVPQILFLQLLLFVVNMHND